MNGLAYPLDSLDEFYAKQRRGARKCTVEGHDWDPWVFMDDAKPLPNIVDEAVACFKARMCYRCGKFELERIAGPS